LSRVGIKAGWGRKARGVADELLAFEWDGDVRERLDWGEPLGWDRGLGSVGGCLVAGVRAASGGLRGPGME
jgi:hypothetical protein